ncbi:MAG: hypothetical protein PVI86_04425 [Phycisphaerae bacterium]|jgi:hypothetical protein
MRVQTANITHEKPDGDAARPEEITEWDRRTYQRLVSGELTEEQRRRIVEPEFVFPRQRAVLAVHWHPEFVPMDLIRQRIDATFPNRTSELIIPTQHNILLEYGEFAGAEVDCYSAEFDRKVQLLVHFAKSRLAKADVFRSMLAHTFNYRSRQLLEFIDSVIDPALRSRLERAAAETGADDELVRFVQVHTEKLKRMLLTYESETPREAIRNKLLMNYIEALRAHHDANLINHAEMLLRAVKLIVKEEFSNEFFYPTSAVIEEVRGLGGTIVVPHPEQFWPILLAEYDIDGYEVWNPQSQQYTQFLITVVTRQNGARTASGKETLILMGDDCHMGEKVKDPEYRDPEKAGREIGVQPAWDDLAIRKSLIVADADRGSVIERYKARLGT